MNPDVQPGDLEKAVKDMAGIENLTDAFVKDDPVQNFYAAVDRIRHGIANNSFDVAALHASNFTTSPVYIKYTELVTEFATSIDEDTFFVEIVKLNDLCFGTWSSKYHAIRITSLPGDYVKAEAAYKHVLFIMNTSIQSLYRKARREPTASLMSVNYACGEQVQCCICGTSVAGGFVELAGAPHITDF